MEGISVQVKYKNKIYNYHCGAQALFFDEAICNNIAHELIEDFVNCMYYVWSEDSNDTPIATLAAFLAQNWQIIQGLSRNKILECFYEYCEAK